VGFSERSIRFHSDIWKKVTYPVLHVDKLCTSCFNKIQKLGIKNVVRPQLCAYCGINNPKEDLELKESIIKWISPFLGKNKVMCKDCCNYFTRKLIRDKN
jgi:hypothetical protein